MRKAIAVDFDGCLCENAWPEVGAPHQNVIDAAKREKENGSALILWTCRVGEKLDDAVRFCAEHGLFFDAVNENLPERSDAFGSNSRKVYADEYWDDRAVRMPDDPVPEINGMSFDEILSNLEDQTRDRLSSVDEADPDCIFKRDAVALQTAIALLRDFRKRGCT